MFIAPLPTDRKTHDAAITIAERCVTIIQACLREDERGLAAAEFYAVAREVLAALKKGE